MCVPQGDTILLVIRTYEKLTGMPQGQRGDLGQRAAVPASVSWSPLSPRSCRETLSFLPSRVGTFYTCDSANTLPDPAQHDGAAFSSQPARSWPPTSPPSPRAADHRGTTQEFITDGTKINELSLFSLKNESEVQNQRKNPMSQSQDDGIETSRQQSQPNGIHSMLSSRGHSL